MRVGPSRTMITVLPRVLIVTLTLCGSLCTIEPLVKKKNTSCVRCGGLLNLLEDFVKIASESVATFTVAVLICMMPETGPHPIAYSYLAFH